MKNNYFYATLQEEISLLHQAATAEDAKTVVACRVSCENLHNTLCQRLFHAFVTPWNREDLYGLSLDILALFSPLSAALSCTDAERERITRSAAVFTSLRLDESVLSLTFELNRLWGTASCSIAARACRDGFQRLAERATVTALKSV